MIYYGSMPIDHDRTRARLCLSCVFAGGCFGTLFAALNINYRDVKFALPFILQVWMIASPVFYPASLINERWRLLFAINPLVGILEGFRHAVLGTPFDWPLIGISVASLMVLSAISFFIFGHLEEDFADVISADNERC